MDNLFEKINIVTQIYIEKVKKIKEVGDRCSGITAYSEDNLNQILISSSSFEESNSKSIIEAAKNLQGQNKRAQLQSCATIY